jgi:hypothetical protein
LFVNYPINEPKLLLAHPKGVQGYDMRKWYIPLTVMGLGGLGVLLGTEKGREALNRAADFIDDFPDAYSEWHEAAEREIESIQSAVDQIAASLGALRRANSSESFVKAGESLPFLISSSSPSAWSIDRSR